MKYTLLMISLTCVMTAFSQVPELAAVGQVDTIPARDTSWKVKTIFGMNGTQTAFVNWSAGGRNNVSVLGFFDGSANYRKGLVKWENDLKFALGGLKYIDSAGTKEGLQKTDDRIDVASTFGYEFEKKWFYSATAGFRTQTLDGFAYPNDSVRISKFMAPAYVNVSIGVEYAPVDWFNVYLSPLAGKVTIVNDLVLANEGAYGVDPAIVDTTTGFVLEEGKRVRYEFGAYFRLKFQKEIFKNIEMKTRVELFSNYLDDPQNVDVNAENIFAFKVNEWFSASLQWNLAYDDDISVTDRDGNNGPRTQFKSVLGLGISYTLTNEHPKSTKKKK
jgi:hypothetical protein